MRIDYVIKLLKSELKREVRTIYEFRHRLHPDTLKERVNNAKQIRNVLCMLDKVPNDGDIDSEVIMEAVCDVVKITKAQLKEKNRKRYERVIPRQIAFHLTKETSDLSLAKIGMPFRKNHATVLHGIKELKKYYPTDLRTQKMFDKVCFKLGLPKGYKLT